MRLLIDTNVFLWAGLRPERISAAATAALTDTANHRLVSSVTPWELAIKIERGRLTLPTDLATFVERVTNSLVAMELPITFEHALATAILPPIHRDPFGRMVVAQALVERVPIVSSDSHLARYGVEVIW